MPPTLQQYPRALLVPDSLRQLPDMAQQNQPVTVAVEAADDLGDTVVVWGMFDNSEGRSNVAGGELAALVGDEDLYHGGGDGRGGLEQLRVQAGDHGVEPQAQAAGGAVFLTFVEVLKKI